MDVDALLEFLGIRSREAKGTDNQVGERASQPLPDPALAGQPGYDVNTPPSAAPSDLMSIVNRNANDPAVAAEAQQIMAPATQPELASMAAEEQRLRDMEIMIADAQAAEARRAVMTPEHVTRPTAPPSRPYINASAGATMPPLPNIPRAVSNPLPTTGPSYAHLDRAGPPLQNVGNEQPVFLPSSGATIGGAVGALGQNTQPPPIDFASVPQTRPNPAALDPTLSGYNPIVNSGPFMTMEPPDPFVNPNNPAQAPTGSPNAQPPPPTPDYLIPPRNPNARPPFPFSTPSAVSRLIQPAAEGNSMLDTLGAAPAPPPQAFAPDGQLINWWQLGQGRNQPGQPQQPAPAALRRAPTPPPGPDQSTLLNQAELARFLAASGMPATSPPPATPQAPPQITSNPPPTPVPVPPGATSMTPPAPPAPGNQLPEALKQQLLEEAYRIVAQRGNANPGAPAR